jgi:predicted GIY-YIG superfamily endonuclease
MRGAWVYIMTNRPNGILHFGVTSHLAGRVWEHSVSVADGITTKYDLKWLVWVEPHTVSGRHFSESAIGRNGRGPGRSELILEDRGSLNKLTPAPEIVITRLVPMIHAVAGGSRVDGRI